MVAAKLVILSVSLYAFLVTILLLQRCVENRSYLENYFTADSVERIQWIYRSANIRREDPSFQQSVTKQRPQLADKDDAFKVPVEYFPKCDTKLDLLVLVMSGTDGTGFSRRRSIRRTWASNWHTVTDKLPKWRTFFIVAQSRNPVIQRLIIKEAKDHQDILIGDFTDHLYNLSLKVILGFEWSVRHCYADYIFKVDDDVFPNMLNAFTFLAEPTTPKVGLYAGNMHYKSPAVRHDSKYAVTFQEYARTYYPRFVSGGGFFVSRDVAERMVSIFDINNVFKLDDVYMGMLALRLGIDPIHAKYMILYTLEDGNCGCDWLAIVVHGRGTAGCLDRTYECSKKYIDVQMKSYATTQNANKRN